MRRQTLVFGVILALVAMVSFSAWPFWRWVKNRPVRAQLYERTRTLVEKNPSLQPAWDIALQDGTLTEPEAKVIVESAGEKLSPE